MSLRGNAEAVSLLLGIASSLQLCLPGRRLELHPPHRFNHLPFTSGFTA